VRFKNENLIYPARVAIETKESSIIS